VTKQIVYRDAAGVIINIGEWSYQPTPKMTDLPDGITAGEEPLEDGSYGLVWRDAAGAVTDPVMDLGNPLPKGATSRQEDIIEGWDGGLYVKGDPRAERH